MPTDNSTKKALGVVVAGGIFAGVIALLTRKPSKASGGGGGNTVALTITPQDSSGDVLLAAVVIDGQLAGDGIVTDQVSVGSHVVSVAMSGYDTNTQTVNVPAAGLSITVTLSRSVTPTANLTVVPQDGAGNVLQASVFIDGLFAGTGQVVSQVPVGNHTISATLTGYITINAFYVDVPTAGISEPIVMTPVGGPPPGNAAFDITAEAVSATPSPGAPAYNAVGYIATVTNNSNQTVTHSLNVYYKFADATHPGGTALFPAGNTYSNPGQTITLAPGQSQQFVMLPQTPSGGDWIDQGVGQNVCCYLVDEAGNTSHGACLGAYIPPGTPPPSNGIFKWQRGDIIMAAPYPNGTQWLIVNEGTDPTTGDYYTLQPAYTWDSTQNVVVGKAIVESTYTIWAYLLSTLVYTQVYHIIGIWPSSPGPVFDAVHLSAIQGMIPVDMSPQQIDNFFGTANRGTITDLLLVQLG